MTEDNETDDEENSESNVELRDAIAFASDRAREEVENADYDVPDHAPRLVVGRASDLLRTATNIEMVKADPDTEISEEKIKDSMEEAAIDVLLALGSLDYEYDLRIADAFDRRKQFIDDFKDYEEAMEDVDTKQEAMELFDEYMSEHAGEDMDSIEPGTNVDGDTYDHDGTGRSYA